MFMYVSIPKCGSPICHVLLTVQNTHRPALLFIENRRFIGFLQNLKLSNTSDIYAKRYVSLTDYSIANDSTELSCLS